MGTRWTHLFSGLSLLVVLLLFAAAAPAQQQPRTKIPWPLVAFCLQSSLAMPQEALPKQAPTTSVVGGYGYKPTDAEIGRIQKFFSTYDVPTKFTGVVIVPNEKFGQAQNDAFVPVRQGKVAFTNFGARRTYVNADLLKDESPDSGVEWVLAHELQHLNDPRVSILQEKMDVQIDALARKGLARWKRQQKLVGRQ